MAEKKCYRVLLKIYETGFVIKGSFIIDKSI